MRNHRLLIAAVAAGCLIGGLGLAWTSPQAQASAPDQPSAAQPPAAQPPATQPAAPGGPPVGGINDKRDRIAEMTAELIEQTHGSAQWRNRSAVQADVNMTFGKQTVEGTITFQINGGGICLQLPNDTTLGTNGKVTWVSPADSRTPIADAQRLLHTLKVFVAAPLMLREPGMKQVFYRTMHFMGQPADTFMLGLNDSVCAAAAEPGAWCMAYANQRSHRLEALANVALPFAIAVNAEGPLPTHAIVYSEMQIVEEVTLPAAWSFYSWTEAAGARGNALGAGKAANVKFVRPEQAFFERPSDARTEDAPASPNPPKPG